MLIYYILNKENHKAYIGLDSSGSRISTHKRKLNKKIHVNPYLQYSWNKYGEESFEFGILEEGFNNREELSEAEKFWISVLKTNINYGGYNIEDGGYTFKCNEATKRKLSKANSIPIAQYSLKGNFIRTFDSIKEASETINTSLNNIVTSLKGRTKTAGGYQWRLLDSDFTYTIKPVKSSNYRRGSGFRKKIRQLDKNNNAIRIHPSIKEAGEAVGVTPQSIQQCLYGKSNTSAGFKWEYV